MHLEKLHLGKSHHLWTFLIRQDIKNHLIPLLPIIKSYFSKNVFIRINFIYSEFSHEDFYQHDNYDKSFIYLLKENFQDHAQIISELKTCSSCGTVFKSKKLLEKHISYSNPIMLQNLFHYPIPEALSSKDIMTHDDYEKNGYISIGKLSNKFLVLKNDARF